MAIIDTIQKQILQDAIRYVSRGGSENGPFKWRAEFDEDKVYVTEGHIVYVFPKEFFFLGESMPFNAPANIKMLISRYEGKIHELTDTNTLRIFSDRDIHVFRNQDGENVFIDEKFYKQFRKRGVLWPVDIKGARPQDPVFVYFGEVLQGIICTVKVKKDEEEAAE